MSIPTLKIGLLSQNELQELASITREVYLQTGEYFSLLDPQLIAKLKAVTPQQRDENLNQRLRVLAKSLLCDELTHAGAVQVECFKKYGVKVKYKDQTAA